MVYVPGVKGILYGSVAIPLLFVCAVPAVVPLTLKVIILLFKGWLCGTSISVATRLMVSFQYPVEALTVMFVGVYGTVRLFVLLVPAYIRSCWNSTIMVYVPGVRGILYGSVAVPLALVIALPAEDPLTVKLIVFPLTGMLCEVSVSVAVRFTVSFQ